MNEPVLISYYHDLSKIYDQDSKELIKQIPSRYEYYNSLENKIKPIITRPRREVIDSRFSFIKGQRVNKSMGISSYETDKPRIICFTKGELSLYIPYSQLIPMGKLNI